MKIAIVGAGISGLVAAYRLQDQYELTILEAGDYLGGHTNTISVTEDGHEFGVDTGFIVFNDRTYPNFISLLNEWGVEFQKTVMSFSVKCDRTGLEYRGADFGGLFAQKRNLVNPKFLRLLYDLVRFKKVAQPLLNNESETETVGSFLKRHHFSQSFIEQYFLPMGAAIWSCPTGTFMDFPIAFIAEFYQNHGLLGVSDRPQWYVITGGSKRYVEKLSQHLHCEVQLSTPVIGISRTNDEIVLQTSSGEAQVFDHVIFGCHADQALRILGQAATSDEREILSAFPYQKNVATLHTQTDVLPKRQRAWAAWNYHRKMQDSDQATVTYCMNILQSLKTNKTYSVTLNDDGQIRDENKIAEIDYAHPIFDLRRKAMQKRHQEIVNQNRTSFCGAYWGNGFHEDGVNSGLAVARSLSVSAPVEGANA